MPTLAEQNAELRKLVASQQHLIHIQRVRERQARCKRLALVSGSYVDEVDADAERAESEEFLESSDRGYRRMIETLQFYEDLGNYPNAIAQDKGLRARETLVKIK